MDVEDDDDEMMVSANDDYLWSNAEINEPFAAALTSTSTADKQQYVEEIDLQQQQQKRATSTSTADSVIYIQTIHKDDEEEQGGNIEAESGGTVIVAVSSNPIENCSSSNRRSNSSSSTSSSSNADSNSTSSSSSGSRSSILSESVSDSVYNQNYDEQSDSAFSAWDDHDDLFDDDDEEEESKILDEHNSQNDEFDDEYEDEYDVDPKADRFDSDRGNSKSSKVSKASEDSMRNDDTEAGSVVFGSRRKSTTKLGSNDAIKFVETPHGKAGFVYQAPSNNNNNNDNKDEDAPKKKGEASLQNSSSDVKQRITPVLTADGKVALLYRGASDSGSTGKYEPIKNFTNNFDDTKNVDAVTEMPTTVPVETTTTEMTSTTTTTTTTVAISHLEPVVPENTEENAILPNINRPLSEVLGIKKNQFTQFRIKDPVTPPSTPSLNNNDHYDHHHDSTSNRIPEMPEQDPFESTSHSKDDEEQSQIMTPPRTTSDDHNNDEEEDSDFDTSSFSDALSKTEVVNLAIIPAFDSDLAAIQEHEDRRLAAEAAAGNNGEYARGHYRNRQNHRRNMEDLTAIHCIMQAMVAIAALATVFGMLGAYFKTRVLDQITIMHWWEMVGVRYWVGFSRRGGVIL